MSGFGVEHSVTLVKELFYPEIDAGGSYLGGAYEVVYARQLYKRLDSQCAASVADFSKTVLQQSLDAKSDTVAVTMSVPSSISPLTNYACVGTTKIDRFMTSRLIADMLVVAACVQRVEKASYVADTDAEMVLRPAVPLVCKADRPGATRLSP